MLCLLLSGCADREPVDGCLLATANQRQALHYLQPTIPARVLLLRGADNAGGHACLIYRLNPEGWCVYDDHFGSRPLRMSAGADGFPSALIPARAAFPAWPVGRA